mmetsp:Transcript_40556/g.96036  ORF Transcript_40556/g.96036 Transcript_40556/m.96036 type:complete len:264 (-) Transcript_40556:959-1750(-)
MPRSVATSSYRFRSLSQYTLHSRFTSVTWASSAEMSSPSTASSCCPFRSWSPRACWRCLIFAVASLTRISSRLWMASTASAHASKDSSSFATFPRSEYLTTMPSLSSIGISSVVQICSRRCAIPRSMGAGGCPSAVSFIISASPSLISRPPDSASDTPCASSAASAVRSSSSWSTSGSGTFSTTTEDFVLVFLGLRVRWPSDGAGPRERSESMPCVLVGTRRSKSPSPRKLGTCIVVDTLLNSSPILPSRSGVPFRSFSPSGW